MHVVPLVSDSFGSKCVIVYNKTFTDSIIENQFNRCHIEGNAKIPTNEYAS